MPNTLNKLTRVYHVSLLLRDGLEKVYVFFSFHLIYFALNLAEILSYQVERFVFLFIYLGIPILIFLFGALKRFRDRSDVILWLENVLDFRFTLLNAREYEKARFEELLKTISPKVLRVKLKSPNSKIIYRLFLGLLMFHLASYPWTKTFLIHVQQLFETNIGQVKMEYSKLVTEGEDATFTIMDEVQKTSITWQLGGISKSENITPSIPLIVSKPSHSFTFEVRGKKDKRPFIQTGKVIVNEKPKLESITISVFPPGGLPSEVWTQQSQVEVIAGSRVKVRLGFQESVTLAKLFFPQGRGVFQTESLSGSSAEFSGIVSGNSELKIFADSVSGLRSEQALTLEVRCLSLATPKLTIVSPEDNLKISELKNLKVLFTLHSAVGLTNLTLHYSASSPYLAAPILEGQLVLKTRTSTEQQTFLELEKWDLLPGQSIRYWLEGVDVLGQKGFSKTNAILYLSLSEIAEIKQNKISEVSEQIQTMASEAHALQKSTEALLLAKEKGQSVTSELLSVKQQLAQLSKQISESKENLSQMSPSPSGNTPPPNANDQIARQIEQIQQALKQLDLATLNRLNELNQNFELATKNKLDPLAIEQLKRTLKMEEIKASLERMLKTLKDLKTQQALKSLNESAKALNEKFQESMVDLANEKMSALNESQKKDLVREQDEIKKEFQKWENELFDPKKMDEELKALQESLHSNMAESLEGRLEQIKPSRSEPAKSIGEQLKKLKEDLGALSRKEEGLDFEKMLAELDIQLGNFSKQSGDFFRWGKGESVDLETTDSKVLKESLVTQVDLLKTLLAQGKEALRELGNGAVGNFSEYLKKYDRPREISEQTLALLEKRSPRFAEMPVSFLIQKSLELAKISKSLYGDLLLFKWQLLQQQKDQEEASQMSEAQGRQESLGKKSKKMSSGMSPGKMPTPAQQAELQQMAAEQKAIREMMGQSLNANGREGTSASESFEKVLKAMKDAEKALGEQEHFDGTKVESTQKEVANQFLKAIGSENGKPMEKVPEREAQKARQDLFQFGGDKLILPNGESDKESKKPEATSSLPGYEKRLKAFYNNLPSTK